jgi:hypothetical protein
MCACAASSVRRFCLRTIGNRSGSFVKIKALSLLLSRPISPERNCVAGSNGVSCRHAFGRKTFAQIDKSPRPSAIHRFD